MSRDRPLWCAVRTVRRVAQIGARAQNGVGSRRVEWSSEYIDVERI